MGLNLLYSLYFCLNIGAWSQANPLQAYQPTTYSTIFCIDSAATSSLSICAASAKSILCTSCFELGVGPGMLASGVYEKVSMSMAVRGLGSSSSQRVGCISNTIPYGFLLLILLPYNLAFTSQVELARIGKPLNSTPNHPRNLAKP